MEITIKVPQVKKAAFLQVSAGVRSWEDAKVDGVEDTEGDLISCRDRDYWKPFINIETGQILNWEKGKTADIHYKICDDGTYTLLDADKNVIIEKEGYVPDIMCPGGEGYGDYIIMDVNADGFIDAWKQTTQGFEEYED